MNKIQVKKVDQQIKDDKKTTKPESKDCIDNQIGLNHLLNDSVEAKELKWKYAAIVFDRLFFYMSSLIFIVSFASIILSNRNFYMSN